MRGNISSNIKLRIAYKLIDPGKRNYLSKNEMAVEGFTNILVEVQDIYTDDY